MTDCSFYAMFARFLINFSSIIMKCRERLKRPFKKLFCIKTIIDTIQLPCIRRGAKWNIDISYFHALGWSPSFYLGLIEVRQNVSYIFSYRVDLHLFIWDLLRSGLLSCRELDLRGQEKWTKPGYWLLNAIIQSESSFLVSWSVHFHLFWIWISIFP